MPFVLLGLVIMIFSIIMMMVEFRRRDPLRASFPAILVPAIFLGLILFHWRAAAKWVLLFVIGLITCIGGYSQIDSQQYYHNR
jgi:uncharacterized membrane protein HdeD (DUF308 family)